MPEGCDGCAGQEAVPAVPIASDGCRRQVQIRAVSAVRQHLSEEKTIASRVVTKMTGSILSADAEVGMALEERLDTEARIDQLREHLRDIARQRFAVMRGAIQAQNAEDDRSGTKGVVDPKLGKCEPVGVRS